MRVLVTGHKGYIGSVLAPELIAKGHEVVGLDSDMYRECTFGNPPHDIPEITKDVRDMQPSDLDGFDAVVHLAGLSNDPLGNLSPILTYEINYKASVCLAKLCKQAGVPRFIFSSSCSNYGTAGTDLIDEEGLCQPVTPYGISKVLVEQDVIRLADENFSPTFLRNATAYGISARLRLDVVLNNLVAWALTSGKICLKSDGLAWRPLVHVEDICRAFIAVLEAPRERVHNQIFNVGKSSENYQIGTLAEIIQEIVPGCRIEYADNAGPDKRCYRVNCDKISRSLPEYEPKWDARKGAQQLFDCYQQTGLTFEEFESAKYKRIDQVKHLLKLGYLDNTLRCKIGAFPTHYSGYRKTVYA